MPIWISNRNENFCVIKEETPPFSKPLLDCAQQQQRPSLASYWITFSFTTHTVTTRHVKRRSRSNTGAGEIWVGVYWLYRLCHLENPFAVSYLEKRERMNLSFDSRRQLSFQYTILSVSTFQFRRTASGYCRCLSPGMDTPTVAPFG